MSGAYKIYLEVGKNIAKVKSTSYLYEVSRLLLHRLVTGYGPDHYVTYSLFKKPINLREWREYLDKKDFCTMLLAHNKKANFRVLEDKVAFGRQCLLHDLPHPKIHFTVRYTADDYSFPNYSYSDVGQAFESLADGNYIVKTCYGSYGINLWSVTKTAAGLLIHNDGSLNTATQFAERLAATQECYLVQDKVEVAHHFREIMPGNASGSIRVHSFLRPDGSITAPYVLVKLTTLGTVCDNFAGGGTGNMLAMIDMENQCFGYVLRKTEDGLLAEISHHPDTGVDLRRYPFNDLEVAQALAHRCASAFNQVPAVGWDILSTAQGPLVLEGNPMFDPAGPQLCASRGVKSIIPRLLA